MYFTLMGKLNARRKNIADQNDKGFTLIELLVVVIIIGILAAIAIPVYLGVQNNAKDSSVRSDLGNAKTAIVALQTQDGKLPITNADLSTITGIGAAGYTKGDSVSGAIKYKGATAAADQVSTTTFCVSAKSVTGSVFFATDSSGVTKVDGTTTPLPSTCSAP